MYLWINGRWYFFIGVIDGYSRYEIDWELLVSMRAEEVTLVVQRALEKNPGVHPEIVHDHGTQFTGREFKQLIKRFELSQIKTRLYHPESNGVMERFLRSLRDGLSEEELKDLGRAREIVKKWIDYYNNERLHAGIKYLRPRDYHYGEPEKLIQERKEKLRLARKHRQEVNRQRWEEQNRSKETQSKSLIFT
jgi:transposase InsO family protein